MKVFLSALAIVCTICPALAQNAALFPELAGRTIQTTPSVNQTTPTTNRSTTPAIAHTPGASSDTAKPEMDTGNLRLVVDNVNRITPTMRNFAYCTANIRLENGTSQTLQSLNGRLNYPPLSVTISFSNVPKNQSQTRQITLVGEACEGILGQPVVEVQNCRMTNMSADDCKKRVEFVPFS